MQKLYWRPARVPQSVHLLVMGIAVAGFVVVERFQTTIVQPELQRKLEASRLMQAGMEHLREHRVRNLGPVDLEVDPTGSGLLGLASSPITTNTGSLPAKRTTTNPNWAAVVVDLLHQAGVEPGDTLAVGFSGSFPALNLAALCAARVMELEVVAISSVGASSWGANVPGLTWLDMERILRQKGVFPYQSVAASLGGTRDRAVGMGKAGRRRLEQVVRRAEIEFIETEDEIQSIDRRMDLYRLHARGAAIAAYVNIGGSLVSIGPKPVKHVYRPGLNLSLPPRAALIDSVIQRFIRSGVPVVNLSKIVPLAEAYGFPIEPETLPRVGEGLVFARREVSRWLAGAALVAIAASLVALLRLDLVSRLAPGGKPGRRVEPMV
jgi:poly-gamma-glutamate system protein